MKSELDYTICPECNSRNSAMWLPRGDKSYVVYCTVCDHEFEHGHYDSNDIVLMFDDLPDAHLHFGVDPDSIGAILQEAEKLPIDEFGNLDVSDSAGWRFYAEDVHDEM